MQIEQGQESSDGTATPTDQTFSFGPFRLFPAKRTLLEDDRQVRLGGRALDLLIELVENATTVVSKDDLMAHVWPDVLVEEGSLRVHVSALRRALGDGRVGRRYIVNVPGRGYCFVASVTSQTGPAPSVSRMPGIERRHDLPIVLTRMIGRSDIVDAMTADLPRLRFITIVGPGGIGKTRVALAVADALAMTYTDGIRYIDLSAITDPQLVPGTLASAFGLVTTPRDPLATLIGFLRDKRMLIMLDSCEHVPEGAAAFAERVFAEAPGVHMLATSREPLRAEGERVRRLPTLAIAPPSAEINAHEAVAFPAIELFVERAAANLDSFQLSDADAPIVTRICRKLDGIPLAIELVAGRVDTFGIAGLAALLDDRFSLVTTGRRTAIPRHRTMNAALEWSYRWLPEAEQVVLRQLAILVGRFSLEAAQSVQAGPEASMPHAVEHLANLVEKSLVTADVGGAQVTYRLLDTTRAYGLERLREHGEFDNASRRHAEYYLKLFEEAEADLSRRPIPEWLDAYGPHIDNLRGALDWAFSQGGDRALGIALTIAGAPLWFQLSLVDECRERFERALACLEGSNGDPRQKMRLLALRSCVVSVSTMADGRNPLSVVLELADALGDDDHRALALWALWATHSIRGEREQTWACAERFRQTAEATQDDGYLAMSDRIFGNLYFNDGDLAAARTCADRVLLRPPAPVRRAQLIHRHMEQYVMDRSLQTVLMFLQGSPDQALRTEDRNYAHALATGHALSQVNLLRQSSCLIALYIGDIAKAELYVGRLIELAGRHELGISAAMGQCFEAMLMNLRGETADALPAFRIGVEKFRATGFGAFFPLILSNFAERLGEAGQIDEGLVTIDEAAARTSALGHQWIQPEVLRIKGRLALMRGNPAEAERHVQQALDLAHAQGALAWELRAACNLAELRQAQGCSEEGRLILSKVYDRFTEGFGRADLEAARTLLKMLEP
jgi:predicted ATPase/DNA-binding winged helix-turn-helix (wHTH) protein